MQPLLSQQFQGRCLSSQRVTTGIPALAAGQYTVGCEVAAENGTVVYSRLDTLNRTIRPWENNSLGREDIIIPPFEPMTVAERENQVTVGVVSRKITSTTVGLWDQVAVTPGATPRQPSPRAI